MTKQRFFFEIGTYVIDEFVWLRGEDGDDVIRIETIERDEDGYQAGICGVNMGRTEVKNLIAKLEEWLAMRTLRLDVEESEVE